MNKALIVLLPTAVGLGLGGILLATRANEPIQPSTEKQVIVRTTPGQDHSADLQQLQRDVHALSAEQDELSALLDRAPSSEKTDVVKADDPPEVAPDPQAEIEANMAALVEQAQDLDRWFYEQDSDPNWTPTAEKTLNGVFYELEGLAFEADCAETACRLELGFNDTEARDNTMSRVPFLMPWAGEAFVATLDEEGLAITIYVAREGNSLPHG